MNKTKHNLFQNLALKITAFAFSAILWLIVTNINDPITTRTFTNMKVTLRNTNLITDNGDVYTILDNTDVVPTVTVRGVRSVVETLSEDDIVCYANVEDLTSLNTVEIRYYTLHSSSSIDSIRGSIDNVRLQVEKRLARTLTLETRTNGEVAQEYQIGSVTPDQNQVRVAGPESIVSRVTSAVASVEVGGASANISTYADIKLYDSEGAEVPTAGLTMNITSVKVSVSVLPVSGSLISATVSGVPADGYLLTGEITVSPESVELAGRSSVLETIRSIDIPASELDVTDLTETLVKTINIKQYLPEGVYIATESGFDGNVTVTVGIEESAVIKLQADFSDITLDQVPDGYSAEITSVSDGTGVYTAGSGATQFVYEITGLARNLQGLGMEDLKPVLNVSALADLTKADLTGSYEGVPVLALPENVSVRNTVTVRVPLENLSTLPEESTPEEPLPAEQDSP